MQPPDGDLFYLSGEFLEVDPPPVWRIRFDGIPPVPTIGRRWSRCPSSSEVSGARFS
jgi:hypothetical protein